MIVNLLRDQIHIVPGQEQFGWSTASPIGTTVLMRSSGIVNQTVASAAATSTLPGNLTATNWVAAGILIKPPVVDSTPYRIKGRIVGSEATNLLVIGYAPAAPDGIDDLITKVTAIPLKDRQHTYLGYIDEVVDIPSLTESDTEYERPLAIGFAVANSVNNPYFSYHLSVQNLAQTAPQFASSVS